LLRQKTPMKPGDFEFVEWTDGLAHRLILARIGEEKGKPTFEFLCPCGVMNIRTQKEVMALVVAKNVTCMRCNAAPI
jgi:hypothetical protein